MQNVNIPAPRDDPQDFHPVPGFAALSSETAGFALFPEFKKSAKSAASPGARVHGHSISWLMGSPRLVVPRRRGSSSMTLAACGWTRASGSCEARMSSVLGQGEMQFLGTDMG